MQWSDSIHRWAHGAEHLMWHGFPPCACWSTVPDNVLRVRAGNSMSCPAGSIPLTLLLWSMDWGAREPRCDLCTTAPPPMVIKVPRGRLVAGADLPGICQVRAALKRKRRSNRQYIAVARMALNIHVAPPVDLTGSYCSRRGRELLRERLVKL